MHTASGIEGIDAIVADVSDQASLEAMCAKTSVLINCVGPVSHILLYWWALCVCRLKSWLQVQWISVAFESSCYVCKYGVCTQNLYLLNWSTSRLLTQHRRFKRNWNLR